MTAPRGQHQFESEEPSDPSDTHGLRTDVAAPSPPRDQFVGAGRSGIVFRRRARSGRSIARKVFESGPLTRVVQHVFLGSANPYGWCEDAVRTAILRRRVLAPLVEHWFGDKMRVARAFGHEWNAEYAAFELHTEFIEGQPPTLHHPSNRRGASEVSELVRECLRPLQRRLIEAGCHGLVWQAGLGNPVALGNFLSEKLPEGGLRWVWIDLESGVPALFPAQPLDLLRFYLPRTLELGRPLFDDVDVTALRAWLAANDDGLLASLGPDRLERLHEDVTALRYHQARWKDLPRFERGIRSLLSRGRITESAAARFRSRPGFWYAREAWRLPLSAGKAARAFLAKVRTKLARIPYRKLPMAVAAATFSQEFRTRLAKRFVTSRIASWERRRQLLPGEAADLRAALDDAESSSYLTDFGVHLGIKPFVKAIEYSIFPALFASGVISETTLGLAILSGGCIARTLYTSGRCLQALGARHELPWIALVIGALPIIGNFAYPLQIVVSSRGAEDPVAQFILYDGCSVFGRKLPIWGGRDTLTEHAFNHLPDRIVRVRSSE